jgi:two-component system, cell cycle sensor histidine kinase and response regulator CckA
LVIETRAVDLDAAFCMPHQISPGTFVCVSITDTGVGMDETVQSRIFDPFFSTKEKSRGTGLGLASAFGIIKNHGGIICVDSEKGHGTTFSIYLRTSTKKAIRGVKVAQTLHQGTETILLVDDEPLIIDVGADMLRRLGYQVLTADCGEAAIDRLSLDREKVDLVILDLIMPGLDGSKTFDRIRKIDPSLRILLSSGYALDGQAESVIKKGCNGFIQKPFTLQELSAKVRSVLDEPDVHP